MRPGREGQFGSLQILACISYLYGVEGRTYVALLVGLDRVVPGAVEVVEDDIGMLHDNLGLRLLAAFTGIGHERTLG